MEPVNSPSGPAGQPGLQLTVNGARHTLPAGGPGWDAGRPLLDVLRHDLGLSGPRFGCGLGLCGACFVLIDGRARSSCDYPASAAHGSEVTTVEGLAAGGTLDAVQQAFLDEQAAQCGYCTSGMIVSAVALLRARPSPTPGEVREALDGNLCRCGTHGRIVAAVLKAAAQRGGPAVPTAPPPQPPPATSPPPDLLPPDLLPPDLLPPDPLPADPLQPGPLPADFPPADPPAADLPLADPLPPASPPAASPPAASPPAAPLPADPPPAPPPPASLPASLAASPLLSCWLDFSAPGVVTISTGKVEFGQGVWTALAQIAAGQLDVALPRVRVAPVSTSSSPDEGVTSGSRSIEESGSALRQACAQARSVFLSAAARKLAVSVSALTVSDGQFLRDGRATGLTYWSVATPGLLDTEAGPAVPVRPPGEGSVAGRSVPRLDLPDKVAGRPRFIHDLVLPGMLFGRVVRPPAVAAELASLGDAALPPGVVTVRDGTFLGAVASTDRAALRSAALLARAARWRISDSLPGEPDLKSFLLAAPSEAVTVDRAQDPGAAARATCTLTAEYSRPFLAHASMAPSCAIARWDGCTVTVWSHSQGIFALRRAIADGLGLDAGQVTVHHAEGAGGYGHNGADDAALDAVLLARAVPGRPVRVLWTREDEMGWAPLGPAMLARLSAGLDAGGRIASWRQDVWSNGFIGRPGSGGEPRLLALTHLAGGRPMPPAPDGPPTGAMGSTRNAVPGYDIPDRLVVRHRLLTMPIRTSSLRSLGAFLNVFAIESFMDELAAAAGADPLAFRLAHLTDPRARRVIEEVARLCGWAARPRRDGARYGLGYARYKGTSGYCAAVAEVEADTDVRVHRLWLAVDVGRVINPDGVINQVEGGAVQSASWALRERVRFDRAKITSVNWDSYPVLRFGEVPEVAVRIVAAPGERESGAGEVAQGPVAGAIGNAVADAAGVRVRDLPLTREQITRAIEQS